MLIKSINQKKLSLIEKEGFTLIELVITIAIMGILMAIAIPAYKSFVSSIRIKGEMDQLAADINFTRSEATKRGLDVSICPVAGCLTASWSGGWVIFQGNNSMPVTASNTIRMQYAIPSKDTLTSSALLIGGFYFNRNGFTYANGEIDLHGSNANDVNRCLQFTTIGNWVMSKGSVCL